MPVTIHEFDRRDRRYLIYQTDSATDAAHAERAIEAAGERFQPAGIRWAGTHYVVTAGSYAFDELFPQHEFDHVPGVRCQCPHCSHDYTGTVAIDMTTGTRTANCPACGRTF